MSGKIKKWFSSKKLKQKVRYLFLCIIGIYIILFFFVYVVFLRRNMMDYALENNYKTLISIGNNLNIELGTISSMSQLLMMDNNITSYLKERKEIDIRLSHNAVTSMYDITNSFDYVNSVYLYRFDGEYIHITKEITYVKETVMEEEAWSKDIIEAKGGYVIKINGGGAFRNKSGKPIISMIRIVNDIDTQKPLGILIINLSEDILRDSYRDMEGEDKKYYYCDQSFELMKPKEEAEELLGFVSMDKSFHQTTIGRLGNRRVLSCYPVSDTPLIVIGLEKLSFMQSLPSNTFLLLIALVVITVFSLVLIGVFISVYITTPIERLVQSMDIAKRGWLKRVSLNLPDDEIGNLKDSYNSMLVAINQLINELVEKEKTVQKAELNILQEQIKPHFLYNTLDTIAYLALQESTDRVYDAIETLGNFYRKFLNKGVKEISLRDEVGIVKDYLKLQKLRYEDVFEDEYSLQEDLMDIQVPKLILQPLVENSLYHGVRLKGEKGVIRISAFRKKNKLHIVVYDSGIGMNEEQIRKIMQVNHKNFGFRGTMERIRYYYGVEDVYEIRSVEGRYTEVDLKIPLRRIK